MRAVQMVGNQASAKGRIWSVDFIAVVTMCAILGLELIALLQTPGGMDALRMLATEGMQLAQ